MSRTSVPLFDRGKRCLYWLSRSPALCADGQKSRAKCPAPRARVRAVDSGRVQTRRRRESRPKNPRRASCAIRRGKGRFGIGSREKRAVDRKKTQAFSHGSPGDFQKAGIRLAVTSARNSGQFGFVARVWGYDWRRSRDDYQPSLCRHGFLPLFSLNNPAPNRQTMTKTNMNEVNINRADRTRRTEICGNLADPFRGAGRCTPRETETRLCEIQTAEISCRRL